MSLLCRFLVTLGVIFLVLTVPCTVHALSPDHRLATPLLGDPWRRSLTNATASGFPIQIQEPYGATNVLLAQDVLNVVYLFKSHNGDLLWTLKLAEPILPSAESMKLHHKNSIVLTGTVCVYLVSADKGEIRWKTCAPNEFVQKPPANRFFVAPTRVVNYNVVVATHPHGLIGIETEKGHIKWETVKTFPVKRNEKVRLCGIPPISVFQNGINLLAFSVLDPESIVACFRIITTTGAAATSTSRDVFGQINVRTGGFNKLLNAGGKVILSPFAPLIESRGRLIYHFVSSDDDKVRTVSYITADWRREWVHALPAGKNLSAVEFVACPDFRPPQERVRGDRCKVGAAVLTDRWTYITVLNLWDGKEIVSHKLSPKQNLTNDPTPQQHHHQHPLGSAIMSEADADYVFHLGKISHFSTLGTMTVYGRDVLKAPAGAPSCKTLLRVMRHELSRPGTANDLFLCIDDGGIPMLSADGFSQLMALGQAKDDQAAQPYRVACVVSHTWVTIFNISVFSAKSAYMFSFATKTASAVEWLLDTFSFGSEDGIYSLPMEKGKV